MSSLRPPNAPSGPETPHETEPAPEAAIRVPTFDPDALTRHLPTMERLREYFVEGHRSVSGWLQDGTALLIWSLLEGQKAYGLSGDVTEIGVYHGKLFIPLALSTTDDEKAHAFDPFEMAGETFFDAFVANLGRFGLGERCRVTKGLSSWLTPESARARFGTDNRFVSVDGSHAYGDVLHDLRIATAILNDVGVVAVDDFHSAANPAVTEAVIDFLRGDGALRPLAISAGHGPLRSGAGKLFLCLPEMRAFLTEVMVTLNRLQYRGQVAVCGHDTALFESDGPVTKHVIFRREAWGGA